MAASSICEVCRQTVRLPLARLGRSPVVCRARAASSSIHSNPRPFSTSHLLSASQATAKEARPTPRPYQEARPAPKPYQPKPPPTSPVSQEDPNDVSSGKEKLDTPSAGPSTLSIAEQLRKRVSSVTETYVAYGVCENLVKECARQADYTIPQAHDKDAEIPKTKDKEDLGVGTGWWFESEQILLPCGNVWL